ncbi:hypothetical protein ACSBR1_003867 [Camellia fascicularis]
MSPKAGKGTRRVAEMSTTVKGTFRYGGTDAGEKTRKLRNIGNMLTDLQTVVNLMMQNNVMQPNIPITGHVGTNNQNWCLEN